MSDLALTTTPGREQPGAPGVRPLPASAETWSDARTPARVPTELHVPRTRSPRRRLAAWRARHRLRQQRAQAYYDGSLHPDRALPVATRGVVGRFALALVRTRRRTVTALLVLHALAALAGLVVPRVVGRLVDGTAAGGTTADQVDALALAVAAVVVVQAVLTSWPCGSRSSSARTCWPRRASTSSTRCSGCRWAASSRRARATSSPASRATSRR